MKLNNKGFTVVELLASFTLTMIIVVLLFEIVLELKDVYVSNALRAKIIDTNAVVATNLNNKFSNLDILGKGTDFADDVCSIRYNNSGVEGTYKITITDDNTINFNNGELKVTMPEGAVIKDASFKQVFGYVGASAQDNAYIKISYVVSSDNLDEDIIFNYIYTYHQDQDWTDLVI